MKPIAVTLTLFAAFSTTVFSNAFAHHAATMFDREQTVELVGTVREFQWTSPHIWIQVQVETEAGELEEWSIEGGTPSRLFRSGWRPTTFMPGDSALHRSTVRERRNARTLLEHHSLYFCSTHVRAQCVDFLLNRE